VILDLQVDLQDLLVLQVQLEFLVHKVTQVFVEQQVQLVQVVQLLQFLALKVFRAFKVFRVLLVQKDLRVRKVLKVKEDYKVNKVLGGQLELALLELLQQAP
jgi:hypothetical protein